MASWLDVSEPFPKFLEHVRKAGYRFRLLPHRDDCKTPAFLRVYDYRLGTFRGIVGLYMSAHRLSRKDASGVFGPFSEFQTHTV